MNDPEACWKKAEALAMLALMYPDKADHYRAKEQHWRRLEDAARHQASSRPAAARSGMAR